jgi:hypothetical protein
MSTKVDAAAYLVLLNRQIRELQEKLEALKELIAHKVAEGVDTSNQVDLLTDMVHGVNAVERFREELFSNVSADFGAPSRSLKHHG